MAYQVIARKYRPQRFDDVVGQEHVTQTLTHAIQQKRIAHAYLFCGPRGTGKTTIARIFAKCLNATNGPTADFDDKDPRCIEIAEGRSLDVLEIDGASNNGVEQVRELRETCKYVPASGRFKIYIIDEVHMLSTAAFNALLKTLEEPPEHVKFMFATTDPEKVLPTILSRCQRFDLRRIPAARISKHLAHIAKLEGVTVEAAALHAIARGAEGAMRDAESTLDQLVSFCGDKIQESDVLSMFGMAAQSQILELSRAVLAGEVETALRRLSELARNGKELGRLLTDLLNHFRNLLIFEVSRGDLQMLEVSEAEAAALAEQSKMVNAEALTRVLEVLSDAEMRLRDTTSKKILLEVALLRASEARNALSLDSVLKQLQELRDQGSDGKTGAPSAGAASSPAPKPSRTQTAVPHESAPRQAASAVSEARAQPASPERAAPVEDLEAIWARLIETSGFIRASLSKGHLVSFKDKLATVGFGPEGEGQIGMMDTPRNHSQLEAKMAELGHPGVKFKFIKAAKPASPTGTVPGPQSPAPGNPATPTAQLPRPGPARALPAAKAPGSKEKPAAVPFNPEDFKNDPLIQKALEIFKGQIVEVRSS